MERYPGFEVLSSLGRGATSEVFKARRSASGEMLALKVFLPVVMDDPECQSRLAEEVEILRTLRHANVVALYGQQSSADFSALELELVEGANLRAWLPAYEMPLLEPRVWLLAQIARGLGAAHELGILHRDLKPENILVSFAGHVKITDFGLARSITRVTMTRVGLLVGSLGYMAPEVVDGGKADPRSDIFSFGAIAYEVLSGAPAFVADVPQAMIRALSEGRYRPLRDACPLLAPELAKVIDACLERDPSRRPESIWTIEAALMNYLLKSGLSPYCQNLLATAHGQETRDAALRHALQIKHRTLKSRVGVLVEELKKHPTLQARQSLLFSAREMKTLFPEEPLAVESLVGLTRARWRRPVFSGQRAKAFAAAVALAVMIGCLPFAARLMRQGQMQSNGIVVAQTLSQEVPSVAPPQFPVAPTAPQVSVASLPSAPVVGAAERPDHGRIRFEIDADVEAFVNGKKVPREQINGFETLAGTQRIRLEKRGFLPIQNVVEVKPGETAVVKAGGGV